VIDTAEDFVLRQIQHDDNTSKLSLGSAAHTLLKIFLKKSAFDFHQYEIAKTYVLIDQNSSSNQIWAYITLMNSEVVLNEGQRPQETSATSRYEAFPAVKIARLAIDKNLQGQGFGGMIMDWCINHVRLAIMPHVGCRFVVVDAKRDSVAFYQKFGFILLNTDANHSDEHPLMFLDLYKEGSSEITI
jgi:predicted GNAT family N-acyltransferase